MENKKNRGTVVALIIFILSTLVLGGYIVYDKVLNTKTTEPKTDEPVIVKSKPEEVKFDNSFNRKNVVNDDNNFEYSLAINERGFRVTQRENNEAYVYIDGSLSNTYCPDKTFEESNALIKFDKDISDIYFLQAGNGIQYATILFLLSDGTVEFMPLCDGATKGIKSYGKLNELESIVGFYKALQTPNNGTIGGITNTLAKSSDGKLYNLYNIVSQEKYSKYY